MEPKVCPEKSIGNYHYSMCDNPEERSAQGARFLKTVHQKIYFGFRVA